MPTDTFGPRTEVDAHAEDVRRVDDRVTRLERKLAALKALPGLDTSAVEAALTHCRLVCRADGYAVAELDEPPPRAGQVLTVDGEPFLVERLGPSPFPGDRRRCAILVRS